MDETFPNRSGYDNDHDMNDIKERLTVMEKYIYDIKVVQSMVGSHDKAIDSLLYDVSEMKVAIRKLVYVSEQITKYLGM